jgi:hypothetical protein
MTRRRQICLCVQSCRQPRYLTLSRSPGGARSYETGGFASPPYDGFALRSEIVKPQCEHSANCLARPTMRICREEFASSRSSVAVRRVGVVTVRLLESAA